MLLLEKTTPRIFYLACGILGNFDLKIQQILKHCRESNIRTVVDVVQPKGKDWNFIYPALPFIDIMHSNSREAREITKQAEVDDALHFLSNKGVRMPIVSEGSKGVSTCVENVIIHQPAFNVTEIDPTGAGDALCAGVTTGLITSKESDDFLSNPSSDEISEILLRGQAAGAACISAIGSTDGVSLERVGHLMESQGETIRSHTTIR